MKRDPLIDWFEEDEKAQPNNTLTVLLVGFMLILIGILAGSY